MKIRKATHNDLVEIYNISKSQFGNLSQSLNQIENDYCLPNREIYIATENDELVSFIIYMCCYPDFEIIDIATKEAYKNKGYASKLLNYFIEDARKKGMENIYLEVSENNNIAIQLYKKFNFIVTGKRNDYYGKGNNAILMSLK